MHRRFLLSALLLAALLIAAGCDAAGEEEPEIVGSYEAAEFTAETGGVIVDVLERGGTLQATLREDMSMSGQLTLPEEARALAGDGGGKEAGALSVPFSGTYTVSGRTVRFLVEDNALGADAAFIQNVAWTHKNGTLHADLVTSEDTRLAVKLQKE